PVLDDLADDLAHPVGDLVVTALRLAARSGGRQIRSVLDDLAAVAREEARMHRRIEVARARPRSDMRSVLLLMVGFVALFVLVARDYLAPYGTVAGQLVLTVVLGIWAAGVWAMGRLGRIRPVERFLVRSATCPWRCSPAWSWVPASGWSPPGCARPRSPSATPWPASPARRRPSARTTASTSATPGSAP